MRNNSARLWQAFRAVVGRSYRVVDRWDIVPSLPPFEDYAPLPFPLWIQVGHACLHPCSRTVSWARACSLGAWYSSAYELQQGVRGAQENGTIVADDRPRRRVQEENWNDHTCSLYKDAVNNVTAVAAPGPAAAASAR